MSVLLIYPTHENCREASDQLLAAGIDAACYPARRSDPGPQEPVNCWNPNADTAEQMGLVVKSAICPDCNDRGRCECTGYLHELRLADKAYAGLCTHKRAEYSGLAGFASGRRYVSIHECPVDILRPKSTVSEADLIVVQRVLHYLLQDSNSLRWFAEAQRTDDEGHRTEEEEIDLRKRRQLEFCRHLGDLVKGLLSAVEAAERTIEWVPSAGLRRPDGIERILFLASRVTGTTFAGQPWKFILAAGAGEIRSAAILVSRRHQRCGDENLLVVSRQVIGFSENKPPGSAVTWFNDATTTADRLTTILGRPVEDQTPDGHLAMRKKAVQGLRDVTRRTTNPTLQKILRGVLADRLQFQRIGIICHQPHRAAIDALEPEFSRRIVKVAHFGSGEDRSSNAWASACDLIVIVGTPRVPPDAVAAYLVQIGDIGAACREPSWGTILWQGHTESGETVEVKSAGYHDEAWRRAQRDLVRAALVQAVGRGRGILESGCEVLLLSNEECGLPISDGKLEPLNETSRRLLEILGRLSLEKPNNILGLSSVSTVRIAKEARISESRARAILGTLEARGLVRKVGDRGGWLPVMGAGDHPCSETSGSNTDKPHANASGVGADCRELHIQPEEWNYREGRLHCPACGKFMGYANERKGAAR